MNKRKRRTPTDKDREAKRFYDFNRKIKNMSSEEIEDYKDKLARRGAKADHFKDNLNNILNGKW